MSSVDGSPAVPPASAIADVLALWEVDGWLTPPLTPYVTPPAPVIGRARTVEIETANTGSGLGDLYDLLSHDLAGYVVVIAGAYCVGGAMWGEILSTATAGRHAVGVLVDGAARDLQAARATGLPLYARGVGLVGPAGRAHVTSIDDAASIQGVDLIADDLIVLDASGCVRIPQPMEEEVLDAARRYTAAEEEVVRMLNAGAPLTKAYLAKRSIVAQLGRERFAGSSGR